MIATTPALTIAANDLIRISFTDTFLANREATTSPKVKLVRIISSDDSVELPLLKPLKNRNPIGIIKILAIHGSIS